MADDKFVMYMLPAARGTGDDDLALGVSLRNGLAHVLRSGTCIVEQRAIVAWLLFKMNMADQLQLPVCPALPAGVESRDCHVCKVLGMMTQYYMQAASVGWSEDQVPRNVTCAGWVHAFAIVLRKRWATNGKGEECRRVLDTHIDGLMADVLLYLQRGVSDRAGTPWDPSMPLAAAAAADDNRSDLSSVMDEALGAKRQIEQEMRVMRERMENMAREKTATEARVADMQQQQQQILEFQRSQIAQQQQQQREQQRQQQQQQQRTAEQREEDYRHERQKEMREQAHAVELARQARAAAEVQTAQRRKPAAAAAGDYEGLGPSASAVNGAPPPPRADRMDRLEKQMEAMMAMMKGQQQQDAAPTRRRGPTWTENPPIVTTMRHETQEQDEGWDEEGEEDELDVNQAMGGAVFTDPERWAFLSIGDIPEMTMFLRDNFRPRKDAYSLRECEALIEVLVDMAKDVIRGRVDGGCVSRYAKALFKRLIIAMMRDQGTPAHVMEEFARADETHWAPWIHAMTKKANEKVKLMAGNAARLPAFAGGGGGDNVPRPRSQQQQQQQQAKPKGGRS
jgi:hypothetical protein